MAGFHIRGPRTPRDSQDTGPDSMDEAENRMSNVDLLAW